MRPSSSGKIERARAPNVPPHALDTPNAAQHPHDDDKGYPIFVRKPTKPGDPTAWHKGGRIATALPGEHDAIPSSLNRVPFASFRPAADHDWSEGTNPTIEEHMPPLQAQAGKHTAAGLIIHKPDGRVWLTHPTNGFGGYRHTFPKGSQEPGMSLQQTAVKEAYEETGLKVRLTGVLGDFKRNTSHARYYTAVREGGNPADMGWESQAMRLVPRERLHDVLNMPVDHDVVDAMDDMDAEHLDKSREAATALADALASLFAPTPADTLGARLERLTKSFDEDKHPRWPKGSPLGGQFKGLDEHGNLAAPKIGSAGNPEYAAKAKAIEGLLAHGDVKNAKLAAEKLKAAAEKVHAKGAAGGKLHSHDKWKLQLSQYADGAIAQYEAKGAAEVKADKVGEAVDGPSKLGSYKKEGAKPGAKVNL